MGDTAASEAPGAGTRSGLLRRCVSCENEDKLSALAESAFITELIDLLSLDDESERRNSSLEQVTRLVSDPAPARAMEIALTALPAVVKILTSEDNRTTLKALLVLGQILDSGFCRWTDSGNELMAKHRVDDALIQVQNRIAVNGVPECYTIQRVILLRTVDCLGKLRSCSCAKYQHKPIPIEEYDSDGVDDSEDCDTEQDCEIQNLWFFRD